MLDLPTPDFSMPYNVIMMSSTVMAVFFGMMHGALTRKWWFIELGPDGKEVRAKGSRIGLVGKFRAWKKAKL